LAARFIATLALMSTMTMLVDHSPVAAAQVLKPLPASTQFDITGFLQAATLDQACVTASAGKVDANGFDQAAHCGGTLTLNGHIIVVPNEMIVILPASALTWEELFALAPAPYGPTQTGMALTDIPKPLTTYEVQAVGNRVLDPLNPDPAKKGRYIAGLVHVSQQDLNAGAGYINYMDYTTGEMRVGGIPGDPTTGARVQINDPAVDANGGRYGRAMSPDVRFQVDQDNPTIAAASGFPMCFPRVTADPNVAGNADDPLCPLTQREIDPLDGSYKATWTMQDPTFLAPLPTVSPLDPRVQVPFEVGDYVNYAGTLIADNPADPASTTYISAHTIIANLSIRTVPGTNPVYVAIEVGLMGTGGVTDPGLTEASVRTRFEGMSTDITRTIHLYSIAVQPDGSSIDRDLGKQALDQAAAVPGRWRYRPPCFPFGTTPQNDPKFRITKDCVYGLNSTDPAPREVRATVEGIGNQLTDQAKTANGIIWGQYHAPIGEYIFPENTPGAPIPPNNFENIPFLAQGGYSSLTGVVAGQLNPWPGLFVPPPPCVAPVADAGGPYTVGVNGTITLAATSTGTNPAFAWTGVPAGASLSAANIPNPVFHAPATPGNYNLTLTVTGGCGAPSVKTAAITVTADQPPTVTAPAPVTITSQNPGSITLVGADPNTPAKTPLTFTVTQTPANSLTGLSFTTVSPTSKVWHFTAPSVSAPAVINLSITATNSVGLVSAPVTSTVTVNPVVVGQAPVANAGGPYTVNSGSTLTLNGSATGSPTLKFQWTNPPAGQGNLAANNTPAPVYTAPNVPVDTIVNLTLTVTNNVGPTGTSSSTSIAQITVLAAQPPVVNAVAPQSVIGGQLGTFTITGTDPNTPALPITFTYVGSSQVSGPPLAFPAVTIGNPSNATQATVSFTAPLLPAAQVDPNVYELSFKAKNNVNPNFSPTIVVTVTVRPVPDIISITDAEYRTGKQRLILSATSNDPTAVLKLLPYARLSGGTFDPTLLGVTFTNAGAGLWTLTLVGAPQPAAGAVLQITSTRGAVSPLHALDRIRA